VLPKFDLVLNYNKEKVTYQEEALHHQTKASNYITLLISLTYTYISQTIPIRYFSWNSTRNNKPTIS